MKEIFLKSMTLKLTELIDYAKGGVTSKQIIKGNAGNITLFSFDQGQGLSEHSAPFDAFVQILEGKAEVRIEGKPFILKGGESIILPASKTHALHAVERFKNAADHDTRSIGSSISTIAKDEKRQ